MMLRRLFNNSALRSTATRRYTNVKYFSTSNLLKEKQIPDATLAELDGKPIEYLHRSAIIKRPRKNPMQQGIQEAKVWSIVFDKVEGERWSNPLMGWTSGGDPYTQIQSRLEFSTQEEAIEFANKHKIEYIIEEDWVKDDSATQEVKEYADNFAYSPPSDFKDKLF